MAGVLLSVKTTDSVLSSHLASVSPLKCLDRVVVYCLEVEEGA